MAQEKLFESKPDISLFMVLWWALFWRRTLWYLAYLLPITVVVILFFIFCLFMGMDPHVTQIIMLILYLFLLFLSYAAASHKAWLALLGKNFFGYRLVLLAPDAVRQLDKEGY
ncbi:MAG: hypothetical protein PW788_04240 [Micavibrio sp.]|nr:hypothetical protein [Micavibrio sp.]